MTTQRMVVVATTPDQMTAEMWAELIRDAGLFAVVAPGDVASFLGMSPRPCQVLAPESQAAAARRLLADVTSDQPDPAN